MNDTTLPNAKLTKAPGTRKRKGYRIPWTLHLMVLPAVVLVFVFAYLPMSGIIIAFQDYKAALGFTGSPWVGLKHFNYMFENDYFVKIIGNTLLFACSKVILNLIIPFTFALLLNEVRNMGYKRAIQTLVYLPHFLSWVIVSGIFVGMLSPSSGIVNVILGWFGAEPIYFLGEDSFIRTILVGSGLWRDVGWGTIIYLAALTGINPELYEASQIDGAGRWKQTLSITVPALLPVITVLFLLKIGDFMDYGFERVFVFQNPLNIQNSEILDTYIYKAGLKQLQYSYATAIGLFKSVVGLFLLAIANTLSRKATGESLY